MAATEINSLPLISALISFEDLFNVTWFYDDEDYVGFSGGFFVVSGSFYAEVFKLL